MLISEKAAEHAVADLPGTHSCAVPILANAAQLFSFPRDTQYVTGVGHPLEARWGRSPEARDSYFNLYSIPEKATEGRLKKKYL